MQNIYKNYNEIKGNVKDFQERSFLLGNGFTMACIDNKKIATKILIDKVHKYFKQRKTTQKITNIEDYIDKVETQFITELFDILPQDKINEFPNTRNSITDFLMNFNKFFTLNYDLVLYFLLMSIKDICKEITIDDGFRKADEDFYWKSENTKQNTYYLHGAFHLIRENKSKIKKITTQKDGKTLLQTIKSEWKKGVKSHIVISSDYETKKLKLSDDYSEYLAHCYNMFKDLDGCLVTFGVSFSNSDKHIIDSIKENQKLEQVYIGYYEKKELEKLQNVFKDSKCNINFYCTKNMFNNI